LQVPPTLKGACLEGMGRKRALRAVFPRAVSRHRTLRGLEAG
jgi:hypothetical protein